MVLGFMLDISGGGLPTTKGSVPDVPDGVVTETFLVPVGSDMETVAVT